MMIARCINRTTSLKHFLKNLSARRLLAAAMFFLFVSCPLNAAKLLPRVGADAFAPVSMSNNVVLVGASGRNAEGSTDMGAVYIYREVSTVVSGTLIETVQLVPSGAGAQAYVGRSVFLAGNTALVGAIGAVDGMRGAAFLYRDLHLATNSKEQDAKLIATGTGRNAYLGFAGALSADASMAVVAGYGVSEFAGAAYVYRNLASVSGTVSQNAMLVASDAQAGAQFGWSVALSGNAALVGANEATVAGVSRAGAAYLFRNLATVTGTATENARLVASASTAAPHMLFGSSVAMDGPTALVGAHQARAGNKHRAGAVYVFRNLDSASGVKTENARLIASDAAPWAHFGNAVALSGSTALVGARNATCGNLTMGAVYLYLNIHAASPSGEMTEDIKLMASEAAEHYAFGSSVSFDGDRFAVGACRTATDDISEGRAYVGSVSAFTTLNSGDGAERVISGISFESERDWIIGDNTGDNAVYLDKGDVAAIAGGVFVGRQDDASGNNLVILGTLITESVWIGAPDNSGNILRVGPDADISALDTIYLSGRNSLVIDRPWQDENELFDYLGDTVLKVFDGDDWVIVTPENRHNYISVTGENQIQLVVSLGSPVSEPAKITSITVSGNTVTLDAELWSVGLDARTGRSAPDERIYKGGYYAIFSATELSEDAVWTFTGDKGELAFNGTFSTNITKNGDALFYRVATSDKPFDADGVPHADANVAYSWNISAYYTLNVRAGQSMFFANQLQQADTRASALFASLPAGIATVINLFRDDGTRVEISRDATGGWTNGNEPIPMGRGFHMLAQGADISVVVSGVLQSGNYEKPIPFKDKNSMFCSILPLAGPTASLGLLTTPGTEIVKRLDSGVNEEHTAGGVPARITWSKGADPVINIGEHFNLYYQQTGKTLLQDLWFNHTSLRGILINCATR